MSTQALRTIAGVPADAAAPVIEVRGVRKVYGSGDTAVHALRGVDLVVPQGDYLSIMGASGSGKSTLLNILGCLDVASDGSYRLDGIDVADFDDGQLAVLRNRKIGFVFQSYNLIPRTTALRNVELPLVYAGLRRRQRRERALAALEMVGLTDKADRQPSELSGGQAQRVAIARALVTGPALLLADEPTGNLDTHSTADVLAVLDRLNAMGRTIVVITHEDDVGRHANRMVRMSDGLIVEEKHNGGWRHTISGTLADTLPGTSSVTLPGPIPGTISGANP